MTVQVMIDDFANTEHLANISHAEGGHNVI